MPKEFQAHEASELDIQRWAAKQGDAKAQYSLAGMYLEGRGVRQDDVEAVKWYRAAAEQGHLDAQAGLGAMPLH